MEAVLGEQTYQLRELKDILKVGLSQLGIGAVPPVIDQVQTGDIRRSRRGRVRVLFLINCIDSNLPAKASEAGIFTDDQREKLAGSGLELAPTARQNTVNERFYLYELVHLPEDRLYVTWSKKDAKGRTVSPSTYIPLLTGLFADLKPGTFESGQWRLPQSETEAKQLLAVNLRELHRDGSPDRIRQLYASLMGDPGQARYLKTVTEAAFYVKRDRHLQRQTVERLYSDRLLMGVSSLERYAACAYRAFLTDVLKLSKRETFSLTAADIGNIDHKLIELFFRRLIEQGIDPGEVDEEVRHSLTGAAMTEVREGYLDYLDDSARYRYYIDRFTRVADRNIWASIEQLKTGSYRPVAIESVFDGRITEDLAIPVDGDRTLLVNGRIDRIDAAPGENGSILRVIDYKTGSQDFDPAAIWHGLSLQLMVYLMAVKGRFRREDLPGGAYYYHIKNPLIAVKKNMVDPELIRREVLGEMKLTGILVDTAESRAADPETTDKGNLQLTPEQLDALMEHTGEKLKTIGRDILWGRIPVSPCRYRNKKACEYCDYAGVCGFDTRLAGHRYRLFPKMDSEEIMEALRGDENKLDN